MGTADEATGEFWVVVLTADEGAEGALPLGEKAPVAVLAAELGAGSEPWTGELDVANSGAEEVGTAGTAGTEVMGIRVDETTVERAGQLVMSAAQDVMVTSWVW